MPNDNTAPTTLPTRRQFIGTAVAGSLAMAATLESVGAQPARHIATRNDASSAPPSGGAIQP